VSVGVGEETRLKNRVGGGLDTLDEVRGSEGDLLNLGEVAVRRGESQYRSTKEKRKSTLLRVLSRR
jgi:hypothetical protein